MLNPLKKPKTLKENALDELRKAIMFGHFKPGEKLVERVLCEQLGVSRTIVRECLGYLQSEHLVNIVHNSSPVVAELSREEIEEIYMLRSVLESKAAAECARLANKEDCKLLFDAVAVIEKALQDKDIVSAIEMTESFYEKIFNIGKLPVSWEIVRRLNGRITRFRVLSLSSEGREKTGPQKLRQIVSAIEQADSSAASAACRDHVNNALKVVFEQIRKSGNDTIIR